MNQFVLVQRIVEKPWKNIEFHLINFYILEIVFGCKRADGLCLTVFFSFFALFWYKMEKIAAKARNFLRRRAYFWWGVKWSSGAVWITAASWKQKKNKFVIEKCLPSLNRKCWSKSEQASKLARHNVPVTKHTQISVTSYHTTTNDYSASNSFNIVLPSTNIFFVRLIVGSSILPTFLSFFYFSLENLPRLLFFVCRFKIDLRGSFYAWSKNRFAISTKTHAHTVTKLCWKYIFQAFIFNLIQIFLLLVVMILFSYIFFFSLSGSLRLCVGAAKSVEQFVSTRIMWKI